MTLVINKEGIYWSYHPRFGFLSVGVPLATTEVKKCLVVEWPSADGKPVPYLDVSAKTRIRLLHDTMLVRDYVPKSTSLNVTAAIVHNVEYCSTLMPPGRRQENENGSPANTLNHHQAMIKQIKQVPNQKEEVVKVRTLSRSSKSVRKGKDASFSRVRFKPKMIVRSESFGSPSLPSSESDNNGHTWAEAMEELDACEKALTLLEVSEHDVSLREKDKELENDFPEPPSIHESSDSVGSADRQSEQNEALGRSCQTSDEGVPSSTDEGVDWRNVLGIE
jgi:hypothetical protein